MKSGPENPWLAKGPLWVIAISLLTIAACLVLLVVRTFFPQQQPPVATVAQTGTPLPAASSNNQPPETAPIRHVARQTRSVDSDSSASIRKATSPEGVSPEEQLAPPARFAAAVRPITTPDRPPLVYAGALNYQTSIKGVVRLKGSPPQETVADLSTPCTQTGEQQLTTHFFVTDEKDGLADTLVYLSQGAPKQVYPPSTATNELVFTNCGIYPYVTAVVQGQPISVRDGSGVRHALRVKSPNGESTQYVAANGVAPLSSQLKPGYFITFACDEHPWEFAFVSVLTNPFFAITDERGQFAITNVPPGHYTVTAWHRNGQERQRSADSVEFTLRPREVVPIVFTVFPPSK